MTSRTCVIQNQETVTHSRQPELWSNIKLSSCVGVTGSSIYEI